MRLLEKSITRNIFDSLKESESTKLNEDSKIWSNTSTED